MSCMLLLQARRQASHTNVGWSYITEISPPHYRGTLASIPQFLTTVGLCAGFFICYGSVNIASSVSWRLPFALQALISFTFASSTILLLPESPRWLSIRGQKPKALAVWEKLEIGTADREKHEEDDIDKVPQAVKIRDILDTFHRGVWKQTSLGVFLNGMQQLAGIDGVLYVCPPSSVLCIFIYIELTKPVCSTSFRICGSEVQHSFFPRFWNFGTSHFPRHHSFIPPG